MNLELRFFEIYRNPEYLVLLGKGALLSASLTVLAALSYEKNFDNFRSHRPSKIYILCKIINIPNIYSMLMEELPSRSNSPRRLNLLSLRK